MVRGERPCPEFSGSPRRQRGRPDHSDYRAEAQLVAYPLQEWNAFLERLAKLPQFDPSLMMLRRIYVSGAVECPVDNLGGC